LPVAMNYGAYAPSHSDDPSFNLNQVTTTSTP